MVLKVSVDENPLAPPVRVIGHRGACARRPEHTLASYALAIAGGADFVEPDLVSSRDGHLLIRHENEIGSTTDVASHAAFADRQVTKCIDGQTVTGWFSEDFTLAELKTLRARERLPSIRGTAYDGQFPLLTLAEMIDFVAAESAARGRLIGIIPEIKHGTYFAGLGLAMEDTLLALLAAHAYTREAPVEIQSFEIGNLAYLHQQLGGAQRRELHPNIRLLQLIGEPDEQPGDVLAAGGTLRYADMLKPAGLRTVAGYADAIGPEHRAIVPWCADGSLGTPTPLVRHAHAVRLEVHAYTFRPENMFLPPSLWQGSDPASSNPAGMQAHLEACLQAGMDAFFTDDPAACRPMVARGPV